MCALYQQIIQRFSWFPSALRKPGSFFRMIVSAMPTWHRMWTTLAVKHGMRRVFGRYVSQEECLRVVVRVGKTTLISWRNYGHTGKLLEEAFYRADACAVMGTAYFTDKADQWEMSLNESAGVQYDEKYRTITITLDPEDFLNTVLIDWAYENAGCGNRIPFTASVLNYAYLIDTVIKEEILLTLWSKGFNQLTRVHWGDTVYKPIRASATGLVITLIHDRFAENALEQNYKSMITYKRKPYGPYTQSIEDRSETNGIRD